MLSNLVKLYIKEIAETYVMSLTKIDETYIPYYTTREQLNNFIDMYNRPLTLKQLPKPLLKQIR